MITHGRQPWANIPYEQASRPPGRDNNLGRARAQKWRLVNRKLTDETKHKPWFEIRFLSGRDGRFSTLAEFLSVYDLPLSQVTFIDSNGDIAYARDLGGGRVYQIVISVDQFHFGEQNWRLQHLWRPIRHS